ncbi:MAG: hypothetical protein HYR91_05150 [Flavobacteriia bacterium]|nr:hypothetical protein [Flavobacteriia bacterium]
MSNLQTTTREKYGILLPILKNFPKNQIQILFSYKHFLIYFGIFVSCFTFGQTENYTTTSNGIKIYEAKGVESKSTELHSTKATTEVKVKSIDEYTLQECINAITDIENKLVVLRGVQTPESELNDYILFKNKLIQRKQLLLSQQTN